MTTDTLNLYPPFPPSSLSVFLTSDIATEVVRRGAKKEDREIAGSVEADRFPHDRLKVKLRSRAAREFGFPLVTEYSQSCPTPPAASAALTLKYDLILPLRTSNRRGKRFRDVPLPSGHPCGCLHSGG